MERLRLDGMARLAGHAVVEKGTHVEILGSQRRVRVDAVEYDGYPDAEPLLSLEEETWRQVTLGAGSAAPNTSGEASSLESVSRGVCAGAAVRREQARDRETVFVICVSSILEL